MGHNRPRGHRTLPIGRPGGDGKVPHRFARLLECNGNAGRFGGFGATETMGYNIED
jgi:hypothetical protein